ncbi:MAG: hypothetical protein ACR2FM_05400 [Candidatus Saccharimonadales bacterium]
MKKTWFRFKPSKKPAVTVAKSIVLPGIIALAALGLLVYQLLSLVTYGLKEHAVYLGSATMSAIKNDILFAPVKGLQIITLKFTEDDIYMRLASVAVAVTAALLLYFMLRKWYTARVSVLTLAMFITSSWFLHHGRLANLDVLYLTIVPTLLLICLWIISKDSSKKYPIAAILLALTFYVPGTWLFVVGGLFVIRKVILKSLKNVPIGLKIISGSAFLLTILPLLYSFALKPSQIIRWLGYDSSKELSLPVIGNRILDIPQQLFLTGPSDPTRWLIGTPVFDIFSIAMIALGLYAFHAGYYPTREKLTFGALGFGFVLVGLGNVATLSLVIPIFYIVIANGISYMLQSWFTVFPRNPVARSLGVGFIVLVIAGSSFYQLQRYFVAWPAVEATTKALTTER